MASVTPIDGLLGLPCTWRSTSTGLPQTGFVVAVRCDEKVQTWSDKYNLPDNLPWRPLSLVTILLPDMPQPSAISTTQRALPNIAVPFISETPDSPFRLFVKNIRKGMTEHMLCADFDADKVIKKSPTTAIMDFSTKEAAEKALAWNGSSYKGLRISVRWSTE